MTDYRNMRICHCPLAIRPPRNMFWMGAAGRDDGIFVVTSTLFSSALQISTRRFFYSLLCLRQCLISGTAAVKRELANHTHLSNASYGQGIISSPPFLPSFALGWEGSAPNFDLISDDVLSFAVHHQMGTATARISFILFISCQISAVAFGPSHDSKSRCSQ